MKKIAFHPLASIFPLLKGKPFEELVADIKTSGLIVPILLYEDKVLDGRNRYNACLETNTKLRFDTYRGTDPRGHVISLNLRRRHLDESQRAMCAARLARLKHGEHGVQKGVHGRSVEASIDASSDVSQKEAAVEFKVSRGSVQRARQVLDHGTDSLQQLVDDKIITVVAAEKVAVVGKTKGERAPRDPREQERIVTAVLAGELKPQNVVAELSRKDRAEKLNLVARGGKSIKAPVERYPILYADPPWEYDFSQAESRAIENQYPTMPVEDICALKVGARIVREVATDDAVLFLWTTSPKLLEGLRVVEAWGFQYRTQMIWDKVVIGPGHYARQQHEILLICTRGQPPTPPQSARPGSIVSEKRSSEHSRKPDVFYEIIEKMYPQLPKIELFSRNKRAGWFMWGFEAKAA